MTLPKSLHFSSVSPPAIARLDAVVQPRLARPEYNTSSLVLCQHVSSGTRSGLPVSALVG